MIKILGETERGCIFRMGRFYRVAGPGTVLLLPLLDRMAVVDLNRTLPQWREISPDELNAMVEYLVKRYPEVPSQLTVQEVREEMYLDQ